VLKNDEQAWIFVEDSGIGIYKEDQLYLFDRFHRRRKATYYTSSGLGLVIVKALAQASSTQVTVKNTSPGSRFTFACRFIELVNLKSIDGRDICLYYHGTSAHRSLLKDEIQHFI
jgi:signal transduction histidine kinase